MFWWQGFDLVYWCVDKLHVLLPFPLTQIPCCESLTVSGQKVPCTGQPVNCWAGNGFPIPQKTLIFKKKKKFCPKLGWNHFTSSQTSWEQPTPPTVSALTWEVGDTSKSLLWMGQIRDLTEVFSHPRWGPWPLGYSNMVCPGCENSSQGEFHQTSSVSAKSFGFTESAFSSRKLHYPKIPD